MRGWGKSERGSIIWNRRLSHRHEVSLEWLRQKNGESMERILVSMDVGRASFPASTSSDGASAEGFLGAIYRAIHLAARIGASVHVLLITDREHPLSRDELLTELEGAFRDRLELMIEKGRSEGITVNLYISHGNYEKEVIRFVQRNRITLLILGFPDVASEDPEAVKTFNKSAARIHQSVDCTVELVQQKERVASLEGAKKTEVKRFDFIDYES
jgi:nucleotide-binding universal stress UspA family protein